MSTTKERRWRDISGGKYLCIQCRQIHMYCYYDYLRERVFDRLKSFASSCSSMSHASVRCRCHKKSKKSLPLFKGLSFCLSENQARNQMGVKSNDAYTRILFFFVVLVYQSLWKKSLSCRDCMQISLFLCVVESHNVV